MPQLFDAVAEYGRALGWCLRPRTIIVEGTSDETLLRFAADLEWREQGIRLLGEELGVVAAGVGESGGTRGVSRELIGLRGMARTSVLKNGRPRYRFMALLDNDKAGREAVKGIRNVDKSILEYKDVFRIRPKMPTEGSRDPKALQKAFDRMNVEYKGLDWEIEDLLSDDFVEAFAEEHPGSVRNRVRQGGKTHREFSRDGKARLHQYVRQNAIRVDVEGVIDLVRAVRFYAGLPSI